MKRFWPLLVMLFWTNPPDTDLGTVTIYCRHVDRPDTLVVGVFDETGRFGQRDSTNAALPCTTQPGTYVFWANPADTLGNTQLIGNNYAYFSFCQIPP